MIFNSDLGNIWVLVAIIWWIASQLFGKKKRKSVLSLTKKDPIENVQKVNEKKGILDWIESFDDKLAKTLHPETDVVFESNVDEEFEEYPNEKLKEIDELEFIDEFDTEKKSEVILPNDIQFGNKIHSETRKLKKVNQVSIKKYFKNNTSLKEAIILKEILGKPRAFNRLIINR